MSGVKRERIGDCRNCEEGTIVKETRGSLGVMFIEVLPDGTQLPPKQLISCYCTSCGTCYDLETILKLNAKHT